MTNHIHSIGLPGPSDALNTLRLYGPARRLSVQEAADRLQVSAATVRVYIRRGYLYALRNGARGRYHVCAAAVENIVNPILPSGLRLREVPADLVDEMSSPCLPNGSSWEQTRADMNEEHALMGITDDYIDSLPGADVAPADLYPAAGVAGRIIQRRKSERQTRNGSLS